MNKPLFVAVLLCETILVGCSERTLVLPPVATQNESVEQTQENAVPPPPIHVAPRRPTPPPPSPPRPPRGKPTPRPESPPPPEKPELRVETPGFRLHID